MKNQLSHILFDLDRTIWDFETNAREAIFDIYQNLELNRHIGSFDQFYQTYKSVNEQLWEEYREKKRTKENLIDNRFYLAFKEMGYDNKSAGIRAGKDYLTTSVEKTALFPNAIETLEYLAAKYQLHIVTNGFRSVQEGKLANSGIKKYFQSLIASEDIGYQKPDVRIFSHTLKTISAKKEDCIMIGDDEKTDIQGAKDAGIDYIWFNPEKRKSLYNSQPEINTFHELREML